MVQKLVRAITGGVRSKVWTAHVARVLTCPRAYPVSFSRPVAGCRRRQGIGGPKHRSDEAVFTCQHQAKGARREGWHAPTTQTLFKWGYKTQGQGIGGIGVRLYFNCPARSRGGTQKSTPRAQLPPNGVQLCKFLLVSRLRPWKGADYSCTPSVVVRVHTLEEPSIHEQARARKRAKRARGTRNCTTSHKYQKLVRGKISRLDRSTREAYLRAGRLQAVTIKKTPILTTKQGILRSLALSSWRINGDSARS